MTGTELNIPRRSVVYDRPVIFRKTFRYRVYPSAEQVALLATWNDALRFLWNLANEQRLYGLRASKKKYYTAFDQINDLTELRDQLPWLADVPRDVCAQLLVELDKAWQRCFLKLAGQPNWKRRSRNWINSCAPSPKSWWLENGVLHFPKLGEMRVVVHRPLEGVGKTVTLVRDVNQWFVCISCEIERDAPAPRVEPVVGIDRGITVLVADSDGKRIANPRIYDNIARRLAHAQRAYSRCKKGSKNQDKARIRVATLHQKMRRQRDHVGHTISYRYSKSHAVVVFEDLRITNMVRNPHLARDIADAGWGGIDDKVAYKLAWNGGAVAYVPAAYSSQTCAECGHVDAASRKGEVFCCTECGNEDHADNNASKVLKQRYLKVRADELSVSGCGGSGARGRPKRQQLRAARRAETKPRPLGRG